MTQMSESVALEMEGPIALLVTDNPPVNALSAHVRLGLRDGLNRALSDPKTEAVIVICAGRTFFSGADISEFGQTSQGPGLDDVFRQIESAEKPVIAAIHGTAFGGGLEIALACHFMVATPSAQFGQPEVKLGLIPGAGGTQRLPRIVGPRKALEMMALGNPIGAQEAKEIGLLHEIVDADLRAGALSFAKRVLADKPPLRRARALDAKLAEARAHPELFDEFRAAAARRIRGQIAPEKVIEVMKASLDLSFDEALQYERRVFGELMSGSQSKAMRYAFFAERQAQRIPDVPRDTTVREIASAAVIGAGTMGGGIAMNFANAGIPVTVVEVKEEALERGLATVRRNYENTARRGGLTMDEVETRLGLISGSLDIAEIGEADVVVEAVFENMDVKKEIFAKLDRLAKTGAILATNTSGLDVNEIARATARPEAVLGLHFFSPANVMRLVEVVRGEKTSKEVLATSMALTKRIGKVGVVVGVCRGFVGNRMLFARGAQANELILEGALPHEVDAVLYEFGLPMGPFAMSDLAGLDIGWNAETSRGETIRDRLCEAGRRGQKTGKGYYDYEEGSRTPIPSAEVEAIILEFAEKRQIKRRQIAKEEILGRLLYPMVNEGAKILEEGIAIRASDIDVIWVNGYGWPVYRGGPMYWASEIGLSKIRNEMRGYAEAQGALFKPAPLIEKLAAEAKGFVEV